MSDDKAIVVPVSTSADHSPVAISSKSRNCVSSSVMLCVNFITVALVMSVLRISCPSAFTVTRPSSARSRPATRSR